jgi:hypothetical protein
VPPVYRQGQKCARKRQCEKGEKRSVTNIQNTNELKKLRLTSCSSANSGTRRRRLVKKSSPSSSSTCRFE